MRSGGFLQRLPQLWYRDGLAAALWPLWPLSLLFGGVAALRRAAYRRGWAASVRLPVPVIVVGNLTVGGSGKTPVVLWLAAQLRERGWRPGIVSRGYGRSSEEAVLSVGPESSAAAAGDEPLLLARRSGVPVFVGRDRVAAGKALLAAHPECDIVISDDGLQHYRLARSAEIVVFDARGAGNGRMLPAGPLREPLARLDEAAAIVCNGEVPPALFRHTGTPRFPMHLEGQAFVALRDGRQTCSAGQLQGKRLYAMAGIGNPPRFFAKLAALGLQFTPHPFPDHHVYCAEDFAFARDGVLLMTEKDAVKCGDLISSEAWFLPVEAQIEKSADGRSLLDTILERVNGRTLA